jgi:hypothetical protein
MPMEPYVKDHLAMVVASGQSPFDIAINLCLYYMKTQKMGDCKRVVTIGEKPV